MRDLTLEDLVIDHALATREQVRQAVWATRAAGHTWIEELLLRGQLDEEKLCDCVVRRVRVPRCDLARLRRVPREVLALIPPDLAAEHRVVPVWREPDGDLRVVVADPTDHVGLEEVQFFAGCRLLREVVIATEMAWALMQYYGIPSILWPVAATTTAAPSAPAQGEVLGATAPWPPLVRRLVTT